MWLWGDVVVGLSGCGVVGLFGYLVKQLFILKR